MAEAQVPENLMQAAEKRKERGEAGGETVIDLIKRSGIKISNLESLQRSLETMLSKYKDERKLVIGAGTLLLKWLETERSNSTDPKRATELNNRIGEIQLLVDKEKKAAATEAEKRTYERQARELLGMVPEKEVTEKEWAAGLRDSVQEKYGPVLERNKKSAEDMLKDAEEVIAAEDKTSGKRIVTEPGPAEKDYYDAVNKLAKQLKPRRIGEGEGENIIIRPDLPELEKRVEKEMGELLRRPNVKKTPGEFLNDVFNVAIGKELEFPSNKDMDDYNTHVMEYVKRISDFMEKPTPEGVADALGYMNRLRSKKIEEEKPTEKPVVAQKEAPREKYYYDIRIGDEEKSYRVVAEKPITNTSIRFADLDIRTLNNSDELHKRLERIGIVEVYAVGDKTKKDAFTEFANKLYGLDPSKGVELAEVRL